MTQPTAQQLLDFEHDFWHALKTRAPVPRAGPSAPPPEPPEWLVDTLVRLVGLTREEARTLSPARADELWQEYICRPRE